MKKSFKQYIIVYSFFVYIFFSILNITVLKNFYSKNIEGKFKIEVDYASKLLKDLLDEEKKTLTANARSISGSDSIYHAFESNTFVTTNWKMQDKKAEVELQKMNRLKYILLANQERGRMYGHARGSAEIGMAMYDRNLNFLGNSEYFDKALRDSPDAIYLKSVVNAEIFLGAEVAFIQKRDGKFFIEAIVPVGKSSRFDYQYNTTAKGAIVLATQIKGDYIQKLKKIINKEILLIDGDNLITSSLFEGNKRIENIKLDSSILEDINKKETINLNFFGEEYGFNIVPIENYSKENIGYFLVGENITNILQVKKNTIKNIIIFQISSVIIGLVLLYIVLRKLFSPFETLIQKINFLKTGYYKEKIELEATSEIMNLANNVNDMAKEIESRETQLKDLNQNLEKIVNERTKKLNEYILRLKNIAKLTSEIHASEDLEEVYFNLIKEIMNVMNCEKIIYINYLKFGNDTKIIEKDKYDSGIDIIKKVNTTENFLKDIDNIFKEREIKVMGKIYFKDSTEIYSNFDSDEITIIPFYYKENIFGGICIDKNINEIVERDTLNILLASLNVYLYKTHLLKENLKSNKLSTIIQLLKSIVHEIKTPLVGIKGFAKMSKSKLIELNNYTIEKKEKEIEKMSGYMDIILSESDRVDLMARDLLDFSSREEYIFTFENMNLKEIIDEIKDEYSNLLNQESVKLKVDIDPTIEIKVHKSQIKKVFTNLIKNSIEAKQGKKDSINITANIYKDYVYINILDNGIGIPENKLKEIFDPLITTKIQGTGLGLSIVKDIIEKHGGSVKIDSIINEYTNFTIRLPKV